MMLAKRGTTGSRSMKSSTMPPRISMIEISVTDSNITRVMKSWNRTPRIAAGRKAMMTPRAKRRVVGSLGSVTARCQSRPA